MLDGHAAPHATAPKSGASDSKRPEQLRPAPGTLAVDAQYEIRRPCKAVVRASELGSNAGDAVLSFRFRPRLGHFRVARSMSSADCRCFECRRNDLVLQARTSTDASLDGYGPLHTSTSGLCPREADVTRRTPVFQGPPTGKRTPLSVLSGVQNGQHALRSGRLEIG